MWLDRLAFRDALRTNAQTRAEYETLKRTLAARYRDDREAYTEHKTAFITRTLARS